MMLTAKADCCGCAVAADRTRSKRLRGGWSVNHYGGSEGFFGWLALQTVKHRCTLRDLDPSEATALGLNLRRLEKGIYRYWNTVRNQPVKRVYVMYFLESQLEPKHEWHLHFHLVPRFSAFHNPMWDGCQIDAYQIARLQFDLPRVLDRNAFKRRLGEKACYIEDRKILRGVLK